MVWLSIDEPLPPNITLASDEPEPEEASLFKERSEAMQKLLELAMAIQAAMSRIKF